jgi:methylenetetrahydrofolate--tRNA-(uracil-5-)-methyltransferase
VQVPIHVIGAGLAGTEAAWQIAEAGLRVVLHEMRPVKTTPAHKTACMAELVCSNSLKSESENTAPWLLKDELRKLGSLGMRAAAASRVPGGHALTVDRDLFAQEITSIIEAHPLIEIRREEVERITDGEGITIIATGPLTSDALSQDIARLTGSDRLYFHDSISPIVDAETIDMSIAFRASRYGKSLDGTDDYVNCPFDKDQYDAFIDALISAQAFSPKIAEDVPYFEACLPIEEICRRGRDTLRFGPMKPVGLIDPRTGRRAYAVVQLRQENARADSYNLVGFQNHLRYPEQARVFRMIPGLEKAEFLRYGQIHRNTYINAPALLTPTLQLRKHPNIFFAGQISGVEGYTESIATGLMAGIHAAAFARDEPVRPFPRETALGSLCNYISSADPADYQPANITFDLLPQLDDETKNRLRRDKKARHAEVCRRARAAMDAHLGVYA